MPYTHTENGVTVTFPDTNYFQFAGCPAYTAINSQGVKEMDFIWWQGANDILWMIEMKGYCNPVNRRHQATDLSDKTTSDKKLEELYTKSVHTLCMLQNNRANTDACCHFPIPLNATYKIVHLLHVHPTHETYLSPLSTVLNNRLKTFKALYNVSSVAIVSYQRAVSGAIPLPFV